MQLSGDISVLSGAEIKCYNFIFARMVFLTSTAAGIGRTFEFISGQ